MRTSKKNKRILFVSHDASRTGAPIVLLHFIKWLVENGTAEISVLLKDGGELEGKFREFLPTFIHKRIGLAQRIVRKIGRYFFHLSTPYVLPHGLRHQSFDVIYLNTVVSLELVILLKRTYNCPVLCHVHENEFTINTFYAHCMKKNNLDAVDHFVAVSDSTRDNLIQHHGIAKERISKVYEFIPLQMFKHPIVEKAVICNELRISGDEFIVGGSGLTSWRKGIDLFLQLAITLNRISPGHTIKLVWVGAISDNFAGQFNYECERLGITDQIILTGSKAFPRNYFQLFDVFALTSREDPFPLVALEAAELEKPILCFSQSGGIPDFSGEENGIISLPYTNVEEMAQWILKLKDDSELRLRLGRNVKKWISDFDVNVAGKQLVEIIDQTISK